MSAALVTLLLRPSRRRFTASAAPAITTWIAASVSFAVLDLAWLLWRRADQFEGYAALAIACGAVLAVPIVSTGAASARLTARAQEDRISVLRLLGLSSGRAHLLISLDVALPASVGVLAGWCCSLAWAALLPFGDADEAGAARPPWQATICVGVLLIVIALVSAVRRLRLAIRTPLAIAVRESAPRVGLIRVIVSVVLVGGCLVALQFASASWGTTAIALALIVVTVVLMGIWSLLGPYLVRRRAARMLRKDYSAQQLVAGRALLEDPGAAWRQVSPLALTSFLIVPAGSTLGFLEAVDNGPSELTADQLVFFSDVRVVVLIVTVLAFLLVACSSAASQIAGILDRRDIYVALGVLGTPARTLRRAHAIQIMTPTAVAVAGPAALAVIALLPLFAISVVTTPWSGLAIVGCLAVGVLIVRLATSIAGFSTSGLVTEKRSVRSVEDNDQPEGDH